MEVLCRHLRSTDDEGNTWDEQEVEDDDSDQGRFQQRKSIEQG